MYHNSGAGIRVPINTEQSEVLVLVIMIVRGIQEVVKTNHQLQCCNQRTCNYNIKRIVTPPLNLQSYSYKLQTQPKCTTDRPRTMVKYSTIAIIHPHTHSHSHSYSQAQAQEVKPSKLSDRGKIPRSIRPSPPQNTNDPYYKYVVTHTDERKAKHIQKSKPATNGYRTIVNAKKKEKVPRKQQNVVMSCEPTDHVLCCMTRPAQINQ